MVGIYLKFNKMMIWIKIRYRLRLLLLSLGFKLGFKKRLLRKNYGERILVFHGIGEPKYNSRFISITAFEELIKYISTNYNVVSLDDYYAKKFEPNTLNIAITFDDGYLNNLHAIPILEKYKIPAIFFITTVAGNTPFLWPDFLDLVTYYTTKNEIIFENNRYSKNRKNEFAFNGITLKNRCKQIPLESIKSLFEIFEYEWNIIQSKQLNDYWQLMSRESIKSISDNKLFNIGIHGCTHANLAQIEQQEAFDEILNSKNILSQICNKNINSIAFPFGDYNDDLVAYSKSIQLEKILLLDFKSDKHQADFSLRERFVINPHIGLTRQIYYLLKGTYY